MKSKLLNTLRKRKDVKISMQVFRYQEYHSLLRMKSKKIMISPLTMNLIIILIWFLRHISKTEKYRIYYQEINPSYFHNRPRLRRVG